MKTILVWIILFVAKTLSVLSRLTGQGSGTALPGLFVEERAKWVVGQIGQHYEEIIFISGTNGKTTTRALLVDIYEKNGVPVCTNRGGANIFRGIASSLIANTGWDLKPKNKVVILEVEEATLPTLSNYIKPNKLILTNVFRDQLDAYGEVDKTIEFFRETLRNSCPKVFVNADDYKLLSSLSEFNGEIVGFSVEAENKPKYERADQADVNFQELYFAQNIYTDLNKKKFEISKIEEVNSEQLIANNNSSSGGGGGKTFLKLSTNLPGVYNVYNVLAAGIVGYQLFGEAIIEPISEFKPVFGRGELVMLNNAKLLLFLIKNPAGFDQVLDHLETIYDGRELNLVIVINDKIADGKDVSWLWDVDLENFIQSQNLKIVRTSGTRGLDILLRLEYAGAKVTADDNFKNVSKLLDYLSRQSGEFIILSTYTATLELRQELSKHVQMKGITDKGN